MARFWGLATRAPLALYYYTDLCGEEVFLLQLVCDTRHAKTTTVCDTTTELHHEPPNIHDGVYHAAAARRNPPKESQARRAEAPARTEEARDGEQAIAE